MNMSTEQEIKLRALWTRYARCRTPAEGCSFLQLNHPRQSAKELREQFIATLGFESADSFLARHLDASAGSVDKAFTMLVDNLNWRTHRDVCDIVKQGDSNKTIASQMATGKAHLFGTTKKGQPIYYIHIKKQKVLDQTPSNMQHFIIEEMEHTRYCTAEKYILVFDLQGMSVPNWDAAAVWFLYSVLGSKYPGLVEQIIMFKAPFSFKGVIWPAIKTTMDKSMVARTVFLTDLSEIIDKDHLPDVCGGTSGFSFAYDSAAEPATFDAVKHEQLIKQRDDLFGQLEKVTTSWINAPTDSTLRLESELLNDRLKLLHHEFERGPSIYQRNGTFASDGTVHFRYAGGNEDTLHADRTPDALRARIKEIEERLKA